MTRQQRIAINNPCRIAEACANPQYRSLVERDGYLISAILTVNVGEE